MLSENSLVSQTLNHENDVSLQESYGGAADFPYDEDNHGVTFVEDVTGTANVDQENSFDRVNFHITGS